MSSLNKAAYKQLASALVGYPRPSAVEVVNHTGSIHPAPIALAPVTTHRLDDALSLVHKRQAILQETIAACETLPAVQEPADEPRKKRSGPADDRPCGWTRRLIRDNDEETGGDAEHCMNPRRRCDRHQGWVLATPTLTAGGKRP